MILSPESYAIVAIALIVLGLIVALLAALESRVAWVQRFCAFFGEGCRRTATFTLFRLPISWWGMAYYLALGLVFFRFRPSLYWVVMAGLGIEITFVTIMLLIRALCVFCILNSVIMALLALFTFDLHRAWPAAATALVTFGASLVLIAGENRLGLRKPPRPEVLAEIDAEAAKGANPSSGPPRAAVEVVEFTDFLCPFCRRARPMTERLRREYRGKIRWVHMDFPLEMHPGAKELARAPRCAGDQGKFWEFQDLILASRGRPGRRGLLSFARRTGLDLEKFKTCLAGRRHADEIERDIDEGLAIGVSATPTFVVNGRALEAPTYGALKAAIDEALAAGKPVPVRGRKTRARPGRA
jgi:protein-disulfide isomerase